jgi:HK97 family phage major capsid protein
LSTKEIRNEANVLLIQAETELGKGEGEAAIRMIEEAESKSRQADALEQAEAQIKAMKGELSTPTNTIPVVSSDVATYNGNDKTANIKSDYKPMAYIKELPVSAQPMWVQDQMGSNLRDEARFQRDTFVKWFRSPSEDMFFKTCTPDEYKAMQEDTDAEGGFFVPEEFINQVVHDTGAPGSLLRPYCTVIRVASKDGYLPTLASATWAAIAEEAAPTESTPVVGQVNFAIEKSGGLVKVSRELLDDSAINLPAFLSQIFQEAQGQFEDVGIISGNGTTQYAGIMSDGDVAFYTMANATSIVGADLLGTYFDLGSQFRANGTWLMKSQIAALVNSIAITAAGVHSIPSLTAAPTDFILGRPNVVTDVVSGLGTSITSTEKCAIFGDLRQYYIFDRVGFTIRRNDSLYMGNDQVGFFATRRGDGQVGLSDAFKISRAA